jgi:hypothetical protein
MSKREIFKSILLSLLFLLLTVLLSLFDKFLVRINEGLLFDQPVFCLILLFIVKFLTPFICLIEIRLELSNTVLIFLFLFIVDLLLQATFNVIMA